MKVRIHTIAGICLLFSLAGCLQCFWAVAQTDTQGSPKQHRWSLDKPAEAEIVFGKDDRYLAALLCCWRIVVYEQQADRQVVNWDWDQFDGAVGEKKDFLVRDIDGDGYEEVAFRVTKTNLCLEENLAVVYSPERRAVFLLRFDGEAALHLSSNLKDDQKVREWLIAYWLEGHRADLQKITTTYDAQP